MKRCKKHLSDLTSIQGVCATCLRQRLFALLRAQQAKEAQDEAENKPPPTTAISVVEPPAVGEPDEPVAEPVSPQQRKSSDDDDAAEAAVQVFYTPPQAVTTASITVEFNNEKAKERKFTLASMIMGFFRSKKQADHAKKEGNMVCSAEEKVCVANRGMSPDVENSASVKQTPKRAGRKNGLNRNVSGLKFCLSPMIRASPNVRCGGGGGGQAEAGFCKNRSRKLADFGRNNNY